MSSRSSQKRITRDAIVLRHMRRSRGLSLNQAGRLVGVSGSAIAHIEQGRMEISEARLRTLIDAYSFTGQDFLELLDDNAAIIDLRDECISILRQLDTSKLTTAHSVLAHLAPQGSARTLRAPRNLKTAR